MSLAITPAVVSVAEVAHAQGDDADTKAARARFQEGVEAFDKGNYEAARASFKQAYALKRHPAVLLNLAESSLKSGHFLEASQFFQQYLNDPLGDKKDDARKGLTDARAKLGRLDVSAPPGTDVTVDTNDVGKAPLSEPVDVEAGNHTVHARNPDGTFSEQKIVVTAGQVLPVKFAATVVAPTANNPTNPENPPANPNQQPVNNPEPHPQPAPTNPPPEQGEKVHPVGGLVVMIAGGALAVGGAIIGGAFAAEKGSAQSNLTTVQNTITTSAQGQGLSTKGLCNNPPSSYVGPCRTLQDNINAVNQDATVANVGVGIAVAGVLIAAGGAIWYIAGARRKEGQGPTAAFTPWVAPGLAGGSLRLSF